MLHFLKFDKKSTHSVASIHRVKTNFFTDALASSLTPLRRLGLS